MVNITQQLVADPTKRTYRGMNPVDFITVHETANTSAGADAQAHANLLSRYGVGGSWHYTVDHKGAFQSYLDSAMCWHAGDGKGPGNTRSIGIEICVNSDGDLAKAVENAAELVAMKMLEHSVPLSRVVQHHDFSSFQKNCPTNLRAGRPMDWNAFLALVKSKYDALTGKPVTPPVIPPVTPPPASKKIDEDGWWGRDTTRALQEAFGTPNDGVVSSQSVRWEDDNPGLTSGWEWTTNPKGSPVMKAIQRWAGLTGADVDGFIGPKTIKAIQRKVAAMGEYSGPADGEFWKQSASIKGLQRLINAGKVK